MWKVSLCNHASQQKLEYQGNLWGVVVLAENHNRHLVHQLVVINSLLAARSTKEEKIEAKQLINMINPFCSQISDAI